MQAPEMQPRSCDFSLWRAVTARAAHAATRRRSAVRRSARVWRRARRHAIRCTENTCGPRVLPLPRSAGGRAAAPVYRGRERARTRNRAPRRRVIPGPASVPIRLRCPPSPVLREDKSLPVSRRRPPQPRRRTRGHSPRGSAPPSLCSRLSRCRRCRPPPRSVSRAPAPRARPPLTLRTGKGSRAPGETHASRRLQRSADPLAGGGLVRNGPGRALERLDQLKEPRGAHRHPGLRQLLGALVHVRR